MKFKSLILPALNAALWGVLTWTGFRMTNPAQSRTDGIGPKNIDSYYVGLPLIMLGVAVIPALALSQTRWSRIGNIWSALALLAILPYGCFWTGGM